MLRCFVLSFDQFKLYSMFCHSINLSQRYNLIASELAVSHVYGSTFVVRKRCTRADVDISPIETLFITKLPSSLGLFEAPMEKYITSLVKKHSPRPFQLSCYAFLFSSASG